MAVGPAGVLVIESKWISTPNQWRLRGSSIVGPSRDPISQVKRNARRITQFITGPMGGHLQVEPVPVLVTWGPGALGLSATAFRVDGVLLFSSTRLDELRRWLDDRRIDLDTERKARDALTAYAAAQVATRGR